MESVAHIVHRGVELFLTPFVALPPLIGLALLGILTGVVLLWMVGKTTSQKLVEKSRNQMTAGIYEIRLYLDQPGRVFKAQGRLLAWSFVYIAAMIPALLVSALPLGLLYIHLESRYGLSPLPVNQPTIVRIELDNAADANQLTVRPPAGVKVTAPVLVLEADKKAYVRLVPQTAAEHTVAFDLADKTFSKKIVSAGVAAPEKRSGFSTWWQIGNEAPAPSGIAGIFVTHPVNSESYAFLPYWWLYWLLIATVAAFALKNKFDVAI